MSNPYHSRLSQSQTLTPSVNLHCSYCNAHLGLFDNEWIRLTQAYASARIQGNRIGSEVGRKVKVVPQGESQKAAAGCGLMEVFCTACSSLIGQYCKTVPIPQQQWLIGHYFYKMSRTYLTDSRTGSAVQACYVPSDDLDQPSLSRKSYDGSRRSMGPSSQTPTTMHRAPNGSISTPQPTSIVGQSASLTSSRADQGAFLERLSSLERQVSDQARVMRTYWSPNTTKIGQITQHQEQQSQTQESRFESLRHDSSALGSNHVAVEGNSELHALRQEVAELKVDIAKIMSAIDRLSSQLPQQDNHQAGGSNPRAQPTSQLGKRKRTEDESDALQDRSSSRQQLSRSPLQRSAKPTQPVEDSLPTPSSTQGLHDDSVVAQIPQDNPSTSHTSLGEDVTMSGFTNVVNDAAGRIGLANLAPPFDAANTAVVRATREDEVVQFSDDDMPGLNLPTTQLLPPKRLTPTEDSAHENQGHEMPIDLDQALHFTPADIRKQLEEEALPKPPKEPAEPKERVQSTEKYLNAELEELGLSEWIGKDKRNAEFRAVIDVARTAHREAKKTEALARKGLRPAPMAVTGPQIVEPVGRADKVVAKKKIETSSTRSRRSRMTTEPLSEVTNRQEKTAPTPRPRKRVGRQSTKAATPAIQHTPEVGSGEENNEQQGLMTRKQQRELDIRNRDRMAQEAMEMEEA